MRRSRDNPSERFPLSDGGRIDSDNGALLADRLASETKNRWRRGEQPDVVALLAEHPDLRRHKSIVLDLAQEEYRHRMAAGESLDAAEFSRRFPTLQRSLHLLIEVEKLLDRYPDFRTLRDEMPWPEPGETFLGFSLIAELGRGAFGRVFLAAEPALGNRPVVLKVAPQGGEEAEMLGKLRHPSIVPVYSVQEDVATGLTGVCMPYLGRATLCDVLDHAFANPRPPRRARVILRAIEDLSDDPELPELPRPERILRRGSYVDGVIYLAVQLADALAYTHVRGICHRDLKPPNVLMCADGRPLLLDFNLSFDKQVRAIRIGGTLPYMAPEQLKSIILEGRERAHPDPRSDLFSLGVIVYEVLSGSHPFGAIPWDRPLPDVADYLLRRQENGPRPIRDKNEQVDRSLAQLIGHCLAFDPECRPESANGLAAALRKQLRPIRRGRRWINNHRRHVSLVGSSLSVLLFSAVTFLALRDPYSVRQFDRGLQCFEQAKYELAVDCFDEAIRAAPDHREALFARGRAYQRLENYRQAFADFETVLRLAPAPEVYACMGHCLSKLKYHEEAIRFYCNAIDMGFDSPAVLNNIGFSYIQLNQPEEAEEYLERAVEADEHLQPAHHNLVLLFVNRARDGQPVPNSAIVHARKAVEYGPSSAELYYEVAAVYALATKQDADLIRPAMACLKEAVAHGLDPRSLKLDPLFSSLRGEEGFQKLLTTAPGAKRSVKVDRVVDPL